jgi:aspartate carbamoyltransferase regulatory subunit
MKCPKCRKTQYFVCSNPACPCHERVPKGKKSQIVTKDGNCLICPYCGDTRSFDYWEERAMKDIEL